MNCQSFTIKESYYFLKSSNFKKKSFVWILVKMIWEHDYYTFLVVLHCFKVSCIAFISYQVTPPTINRITSGWSSARGLVTFMKKLKSKIANTFKERRDFSFCQLGYINFYILWRLITVETFIPFSVDYFHVSFFGN